MTEHVHDWTNWVRMINAARRNGVLTPVRTGHFVRECRVCGRPEARWNESLADPGDEL